ncbi:T9SS type A sorting domain-containing protein [Dysgonomonas sp. 520]|uniref:T9SS type A sorting domain-containing protein n=1 Tax=Dysgonomonas sp. 520 TaxID=2302931 RepID=UPI0013D5C158|nr:T9SS type A sorting domain-containing protein [Dysgonomonas sp. 520]
MKEKKLLLTIVALLAWWNVKSMQAQDVFPTSDAIWVIHKYIEKNEQIIYGLSGDTIINEQTYKKLYLLNDTTLNIDEGDIFVAGIRQADKRVWVQPADKKDGSKFDEFLMYDFSKSVDEEINFGKKPPMMGWPPNNCFSFECVSTNIYNTTGVVYSVEKNNDNVFLYIDTENSIGLDIWIEGIGSLGGLFFHPLQFPSGFGSPIGYQLICMKEKNHVKYMKEGCTSCFETPTASIENNNIENQLKVAYKQKDKIIKIIFSEFVPGLDFVLFTANGEVVNTFALADSQTNINVHSLSAGLYLYKITGKNRYQSGKLIID